MTGTHGYVPISRRPLDLEDYVDVARRHVAWIAGPLFAGVVISIVVALLLPNTYVSKATMQIVPAQISDRLVPTTITQQLTDRIIQMQSNILSRTSLSNIIQSPTLQLYQKERATKPLEDVIETMRNRDLRISIDPGSTVSKNGASSFTITFAYANRFKAQQTVQAVINRFIDENTNTQRTQTNLLKDFFGDELASSKASLEKSNEDLAKFRAANAGRLPEQAPINMRGLESVQTQVTRINDDLNRLTQQKMQLEQYISTAKNNKELYSMMEKDSPEGGSTNPVVKRNEELIALNKQIEVMEANLGQLLQVYRESYPEIRDMRKRLAVVKRDRDEKALKYEQDLLAEEAKPKSSTPRKQTNYSAAKALNDLQGQIDSAQTTLKMNDQDRAYRLKELEKYNRELDEYKSRLAQTSLLEAKYADLQREAKTAADKYQEALKKAEMTSQNSDLISRKAGESLEVLDPPFLPITPSSPNRPMIVGAGTAVAFMLGLALAGLQEAKDTSLKNLKDVRAYTNLPVLCSIPLLENTMLVKRKKRVAYLAWSAAVIVGIIAVCAAAFYYTSVTSASS